MGRGRHAGGVDEVNGRVRVRFHWQGKRRSVVLSWAYNPANVRRAGKLLDEIRDRIRVGSFNPRAYFEHWKYDAPQPKTATFGDYATLWLAKHADAPKSTRKSYETALRVHWHPTLEQRPIAEIRHSELVQTIADRAFQHPKTRNNALIALRGPFALAVRDRIIGANDDPTVGIENAAVQVPPPDPLTREEATEIIAWERKRYGEGAGNYREFAFNTGIRCPSEIIELRWGDVDFQARTVRVQRARVHKEAKSTKTHVARDVLLTDVAFACLTRQKGQTYLAGGLVFMNEATGRPFVDDQEPRKRWTAALKALGIRHRDAYQTRHSFASWAIENGVNLHWLAAQMGHSVPVLLRTYAAIIHKGQVAERELAKLNAVLSGHDRVTVPIVETAKLLRVKRK